jgi:hypothetical protein
LERGHLCPRDFSEVKDTRARMPALQFNLPGGLVSESQILYYSVRVKNDFLTISRYRGSVKKTMFKIIKFIQKLVNENKLLAAEKEQQEKEAYSVERVLEPTTSYLVYREDEKEVTAQYRIITIFTRETKLFRNSYRIWKKPRREEITPFDHQKITNRFVKYLACFGCEVILDDAPFESMEQIKERLTKAGIKFKDHGDFVTYEAGIEEERKREDSMLNRMK